MTGTINTTFAPDEPEGSAQKRDIDLEAIRIPDLWHVAMSLQDAGDKRYSAILATWNLCHDLLDRVRELDVAAPDFVPYEPDDRNPMLIDQWAKHREDGMVYKLVIIREYERTENGGVPRIFALICNAEYGESPEGRIYSVAEHEVEVEPSAFNDFDHLCGFAKEVADILHCDPATIVGAI